MSLNSDTIYMDKVNKIKNHLLDYNKYIDITYQRLKTWLEGINTKYKMTKGWIRSSKINDEEISIDNVND